jgi:hypothetical protein
MFVNTIRRKTMTYNKPEVTKLASSVEAIQGSSNKSLPVAIEVQNGALVATSTAYEADE